MKLATKTLPLVGALLLGVAGVSSAGHGLLDQCDCASQKGPSQKGLLTKHLAQKRTASQKGCGSPTCAKKGVAQKGRVAQKGCGKEGCGSKGHRCSVCIPNPVHAMLHGIDQALNTIFRCNSCGKSKGCSNAKIAQKGRSHKSSCGCGSATKGSSGPANPFADDELEAPPISDTDESARNQPLWNLPTPARHRHQPTVARRSVVRPTSVKKPEPRALPVESAEPILEQSNSARKAAPVIKASQDTKSGLRIPKNPLRGA